MGDILEILNWITFRRDEGKGVSPTFQYVVVYFVFGSIDSIVSLANKSIQNFHDDLVTLLMCDEYYCSTFIEYLGD